MISTNMYFSPQNTSNRRFFPNSKPVPYIYNGPDRVN